MRAVGALLLTDLRQLVRSRRALLAGVLLPIVVWPVVLFISQRVSEEQRERLEETTYLWSVSGPEAESVRRLLALGESTGAADATASLGLGPAAAEEAALHSSLQEVDPAPTDPRRAIEGEELHVWIEALPAGTPVEKAESAREGTDDRARTGDHDRSRDDAGRDGKDDVDRSAVVDAGDDRGRSEDRDPASDRGAASSAPSADRVPSTVPVLRAHFRADRDLSREALERLELALERGNELRRERLLLDRGFGARPSEMGVIETTDVASPTESTGLALGRFISALLVSLLLAGGSVVASDSLAGEKERGTLETLLTTALSRVQLVIAKQLSILVVALSMTALQLAAIWMYVGSGLIDLPEGMAIGLTPGLALLLFLLYLPVAALLASGLLLASAYAKSYKEAQLYFLPAFLIGVAPTLAPVLPGASLRSVLLLVPIANVSLAVKDLLAGDFDPLLAAAAWLVTALAAAALSVASARLLTKESLISSVQLEASGALPGPELFRRDVLRWTAALWSLILVASLFMGTGDNILERQIAFNLGAMLLATTLLVRRYRLNARETLSLRAPRPVAWLAVLVGAPAGLVVGLLLVQATAGLLPVPEEAIRQFMEQMLPADMARWKLALLIVLLPAVIEELLFRGVLLSGLAGHRTALRVLVTAVAFALFHVSFFRLVPTAFLGALLALATLWTGSIFPAMLWHGLNNAIAAFALEDLETVPVWASVAAVPTLVLAIYLLWRSRRR